MIICKWKVEIELIDTPSELEEFVPLSHEEIKTMLERCLMHTEGGVESKLLKVSLVYDSRIKVSLKEILLNDREDLPQEYDLTDDSGNIIGKGYSNG